MTKQGRPPADPEIGVLIQNLVDHRCNTATIISRVQQKYEAGASARNIQRLIARAKVSDETPPWTPISEEDAENAVLLLPVVREVAERTKGRRRVTQAQAERLLWVRRLAADLPPWVAFRLVLTYQRRGAGDTEDIDAFITFSPWRGKAARAAYWSWVLANRPEWLTEVGTEPVLGYAPAADGVMLACDLIQEEMMRRTVGPMPLIGEYHITILPAQILPHLCDASRDLIEKGRIEDEPQS